MEKPPRYPVVRPLVMLLAMLVSHASATVALSSTMGVSDKILDGLDEVDVIIAGGTREALVNAGTGTRKLTQHDSQPQGERLAAS